MEYVLDPLDGDIVAESFTEECQFAAAELGAELRCFGNRAVIFYKLDRSIPNAPALGHVAFIASDLRQGGYAFSERPVSAGHPRAINFHLFQRPLGGQTFQASFSGRTLNRLKHGDGEFRVGVRESIVGLGRELPYACGPTDLPPLIREVDHPLTVKDGEVLANSHGRNVQPFPNPRGSLGSVSLKLIEDTVPTGTGSFRVHAGHLHVGLWFSKFRKYLLYKYK